MPIQLLGGEVGDNVTFRSTAQPIILEGTRLGNNSRFSGQLVFRSGIVGDYASTGPITMSGGSIGDHASIGGTTMSGGTIGDEARFRGEVTLSGGSIGRTAAFFDPVVVNHGTVGDEAYFSRAVELIAGAIGDKARFLGFGETLIRGGSIGDEALFSNPVQLLAGSIGDKAVFDRNRETLVSGGAIGDEAYFSSPVQIKAGAIGDDAEFIHSLLLSGGSIGNGAEIVVYDRDGFTMTGGSLGSDAEISGDTSISGGDIGDRVAWLSPARQVDLIGKHFVLDGIDLTQAMQIGDAVEIQERDVVLSGILSDGSAFELNLNTDPILRDSTDYFHRNVKIIVTYVPEPATAVVLLVGTLALGRRRCPA